MRVGVGVLVRNRGRVAIAAALAVAVGLAVAGMASHASGAVGGLLKVRLGGDNQQTRLVVDLDRAASGKLISDGVADGHAVLLLPTVSAAGGLQGAGQGLVKAWAFEQTPAGARLQLDLSPDRVGRCIDDLGIGFGVKPGAHSDPRAEWIASSEISFYKGFVDNHRALPALTHRQRLICRDDIQGIVFVKVSSSDNPGSEGREEPGSDGVHLDLAVGNVSFTSLDRQRITPRSPEE